MRIEDELGKKHVLPVAYCYNEATEESRWMLKGFTDNGNKPIYGLNRLAENEFKPVLIVEGEKTANVAQNLLPDHVVISWMGGAQSVDRVDWAKFTGRVVTIWPDNDTPGVEAAKRVAEHINNHNGFNGLVSIVDTQALNLPIKWDLADELPKHLAMEELLSIVDNAGNGHSQATDSEKDVLNQGQQSNGIIFDSIDMLVETNRIDTDEYASKEIYHDTMVAIAKAKNIDLTKSENFIDDIRKMQDEYRAKQRNYTLHAHVNSNNSKTANNSTNTNTTKEQLIQDLVRDTCVLHQIQYGVNKLTNAHMEHIENTAKEEVASMKQFGTSDKEHASSNMYKVVTSSKWREKLTEINEHKSAAIRLKCREGQLETKNINSALAAIQKEKLDAKDLDQVMNAIKKEQRFLSQLYGNLKYPEYHGKQLKESISSAWENEKNNTFEHLQTGIQINQMQGISNKGLTDILQASTNISESRNHLHQMAKENRERTLHFRQNELKMLEKLGTKLDYDQLTGILRSMSSAQSDKYVKDLVATETKNYITPLLHEHEREKRNARTLPEMLAALKKEQATYVHLHKEHPMAVYIMDKKDGALSLSLIIKGAEDLHKVGGMSEVEKTIAHAVGHKLKTIDEVMSDLKENGNSLKKIHESLSQLCRSYHTKKIDLHLKSLDQNKVLHFDSHTFNDPAAYLNHLKNEHHHRFMPIQKINTMLQQHDLEHHQKQQNLSKELDGPDL